MMRRDPCRFSPPSGASSSRDADDGESASESEPFYAVRRILALKRVWGGKLEYEIEWEPDPTTDETYDSSFEPEDNLASALVEEFRQQHPQLIEQVVPALQSEAAIARLQSPETASVPFHARRLAAASTPSGKCRTVVRCRASLAASCRLS